MAQVPISALPPGGPLTGTEEVPCVQAGATVRIPSAALVGPTGPPGPPGPTNNHVLSGGSAPTVAYLPADGGASILDYGTDSAGELRATAGTGNVGLTDVVSVTFAVPFTSTPAVVLQPGNNNTPALGAYVTVSNAGFTISVQTWPAGLTASWNYVVVGAPS